MSKSATISNQNRISPAVACLALYFVMMPFDSFPVFSGGTLLRIVALLPIGAIIILHGKLSFRFDALTSICLIYTLVSAATIFYTINLPVSQTNIIRLLMNMALVLCVGGLYNDYNPKEVRLLKGALVLGGAFTIALTLIFSDYSTNGRLTININGVTQDQNYINGYLLFALVYFIISLIKKGRVWALLPIAAILGFTLLTGSRGALVALMAVLIFTVFYIVFSSGQIKIKGVIMAVVLAVILLAAVGYVISTMPKEVAERFSMDYIEEHGSTGRTDIWKYLLGQFRDSPLGRQLFGYGYGTVPMVNKLNGLVAHNLWIDHLICGGIVGLTVFSLMHLQFIITAWKTKDIFVIGSYVGFLVMCMSLSLYSFKPLWNCMMMIMIIRNVQKKNSAEGVDANDLPNSEKTSAQQTCIQRT